MIPVALASKTDSDGGALFYATDRAFRLYDYQ